MHTIALANVYPASRRSRLLHITAPQVHPLTVVVHLLGSSSQQQQAAAQQPRPLLTVRFQYYTLPKLVGAFCSEGSTPIGSEDEGVLGSLFPGDIGDGEVRSHGWVEGCIWGEGGWELDWGG